MSVFGLRYRAWCCDASQARKAQEKLLAPPVNKRVSERRLNAVVRGYAKEGGGSVGFLRPELGQFGPAVAQLFVPSTGEDR